MILVETIGPLKMEIDAYNQAWLFSWLFHVVIIIGSMLQYVLFNLYNKKYHPMVVILNEFTNKVK